MKLQSKKAPRLGVLLLVLLMLATLIPSVFAADAPAETSAPEETMVAPGEAPEAASDEWTCKVCSTANQGGDKCAKCSASRPTTTLSVIALVVLVIVIAIGFIKKVNLGFLAIGAAFILSIIAGIGPKYVTKAFDSDMFVTLVGVTFLFGMASQNGTLDLFSKKVVALVGKRTVLIPILMFFLSAFILIFFFGCLL